MRIIVSITCLLIISSSFLPAQQLTQQIVFDELKGAQTVIQPAEGAAETYNPEMPEVVDVIIQFKEPPLFIAALNKNKTLMKTYNYKTRFNEFSRDLRRLYSGIPGGSAAPLNAPETGRQYYKIFFGVNASIPRKLLDAVSGLSYVKKVHLNKEVRMTVEPNISLINADDVWISYGRGDSVKISIIDTGIDYMHPDLGGGYGSSFKVIGGYDFVNDDADPADDNGHGTHVAGIASGNGIDFKGVAPGASLIAYKVLNAGGVRNGSRYNQRH